MRSIWKCNTIFFGYAGCLLLTIQSKLQSRILLFEGSHEPICKCASHDCTGHTFLLHRISVFCHKFLNRFEAYIKTNSQQSLPNMLNSVVFIFSKQQTIKSPKHTVARITVLSSEGVDDDFVRSIKIDFETNKVAQKTTRKWMKFCIHLTSHYFDGLGYILLFLFLFVESLVSVATIVWLIDNIWYWLDLIA